MSVGEVEIISLILIGLLAVILILWSANVYRIDHMRAVLHQAFKRITGKTSKEE